MVKWHRAAVTLENGEHKSKACDSKAEVEDFIAKVIEKDKPAKIKISNFNYREKQRKL